MAADVPRTSSYRAAAGLYPDLQKGIGGSDEEQSHLATLEMYDPMGATKSFMASDRTPE